jgi:hypothetical protein
MNFNVRVRFCFSGLLSPFVVLENSFIGSVYVSFGFLEPGQAYLTDRCGYRLDIIKQF